MILQISIFQRPRDVNVEFGSSKELGVKERWVLDVFFMDFFIPQNLCILDLDLQFFDVDSAQ